MLSSQVLLNISRREFSIYVAEHRPKGMGRIFIFFLKIDLCSAISFKRSRGELSYDVAKRRSILKSDQYTYYPRFTFSMWIYSHATISKTGKISLKQIYYLVTIKPH